MGRWKTVHEVNFNGGNDNLVYVDDAGNVSSENINRFLLLSILAELKSLNRLLRCPNFLDIPKTLNAIKRNTTTVRKMKLVGGKK